MKVESADNSSAASFPFNMPLYSSEIELISVVNSFEIRGRNPALDPLLAFYKFKRGLSAGGKGTLNWLEPSK